MAKSRYYGWQYRTSGSGKKYGNIKAQVDGRVFDSRKEARRFIELQMLQQAGAITALETQRKYLLIPEQREPEETGPRGGKRKGKIIEREVAYIADFVYTDTKTGETVVEDTKSRVTKTKEYILKRKMMLFFYGIRIREI